MINTDKIIKLLKNYISPTRIDHSIRVADTASRIAKIHGLDQKKLEYAGLLHDIAKELNPEKLISLGINVDAYNDLWIHFKSIWHAFTAPEIIKIEFPELLDDIKDIVIYHTTGAADLSNEAKALFIADFIEPKRTFEQVDEIRLVSEHSLEEAVARISRSTINKLIEKSVPIHPYTFECWNYYCNYIPNR